MSRRGFLSRLLPLSLGCAAPWLWRCAPARRLSVGIHPWIGYETLRLAREFGWLPETINLLESGTVGDSLAALAAGEADAACLTLDETLRARVDGIPLTVATIFDISMGADVVLARPPIQVPRDLAGKRLGVERSAVGALVLERLLEVAGLSKSDLILIDLPIDKQLAAWRSGAVDALIAYPPTSDWAMREGALRLFDSRQMPETVFDVLAVHRDRCAGLDVSLRALVAGHFRALDHIRTNRQDAIYRIAAHLDVSPDEAGRALRGVMLPSLGANWEYLATGETRLTVVAKTLSALMSRDGLLQREDSLDALASPAWLPTPG